MSLFEFYELQIVNYHWLQITNDYQFTNILFIKNHDYVIPESLTPIIKNE